MMTDNINLIWSLIPVELLNTLFMVICSTFFAIVFGLPLGIILVITDEGHVKENYWLHWILSSFVNIGRSFPFAILIVALIPFTRMIIGTSLGTSAAIVPLSIATIPFMARLVEAALKEVDRGMIEAAIVMGSTCWQLITKVLLPESFPALILALTTTMINIIGYSAMAGTMGGGGLGKIAIQYGYQRFNIPLMIVTVIILVLLVQCIQYLGEKFAKRIVTKRGTG